MQKIGSSTKKIKATIGENLDAGEILRRPSSLDSLPVDTEETATQEGLHSAPETSTKPKTRSRLSAAIRKLSKSRRKKKDKSLPKTTSPEPSETIVSSGAEEQPSESIAAGGQENLKQKKPSKLSKRFLLAGLKRSKISPKQDPVEKDDIPTVRTLSQTTSTDELITQSGKQSPSAIPKYTRPSLVSDLVASGGLQRVDRISKVQITLRGKKVVPAQSSDDVRRRVFSAKTTAAKAASDSIEELQKEPTEKDYLTPTEEDSSAGCHTSSAIDQVRDPSASPASSSSTHGTVTDLAKAKKKKIKSKKIYNTTTTSTASCKATQASSIPTVTPISPFTGTTSITSPPTTAPPTEEKFVITQSRRDTPPLEQAPAKPSRVAVVPVSQPTTSTGEIRKPIIRAAPSLTAKRYESRRTTIAVQQSNTLHSATETESDLMQGGFERGHRFPKPTTPIAIEPNPSTQGNKTLESTDATTPAVTNPQQRQRQIKFQLQSVASQNLSQPSPPPSPIEDFAEQPTTSSFLQKPRNSPPPPPPVTSGAATSTSETSESRSPDRSNSLLPSEQLYLATRILPKEVKSVASAHRNDPDEAISSAESAQQQDSDLYSSYNRRARYSAGYALSQDSQSTLRAEDSNDSDKSSASPVSESNRRRIRYVAQPTLYDENDRIESRREALSYLFSAAVIDSTDSDFDQYDGYQMPAFGDLTMEQMEPPIMTSTGEKREHLYKILVIGELGTGKTSFIKRYVHQFFSQNYRATIGVDFALKVLHWDANTVVRLQLWDIAGQERFGNMTRVYYKEAVGAFIVFDVTRSGTFDCVSKWKDDLDSKVQLPDGSPIPCILLANKCDQDKQGIVATPEKIDEYVRENGFAGWFETSAKENINIDEAARALVNKILLNDKLISDADLADSEKFNLNTADPTSSESKGKCSC